MGGRTWVAILTKFYMVKNRNCLIDSSVVMALFNLDDRQHQKAIEVFKLIKSENLKVKISCITVVELVSLMKYKKISQWQKYCNELIDGRLFLVDNAYLLDKTDLAWNLAIKEENIGMVDAIEIEHCLNNGEELLTFDKRQEEVWRRLDKRNKI